MCYHNYTQHNGCSHLGESHTQPWTLCPEAEARLTQLRGPMSPPLSPASAFPQPQRTASTSSSSRIGKRFASFSATLSRSSTTASLSSNRRAVSGPSPSRASTSSYISAGGGEWGIPDHQLEAVKCKQPERRTQVSSEMDVCKECAKWIREMRFLLERYEKTGVVKGTRAFEEFLRTRGEEMEEWE